MEDDTFSIWIDLIAIAIIYGLPVLLAIGGLVIGSYLERKHFESIQQREKVFQRIPVYPTAAWEDYQSVADGKLVVGSVVVSLDYFKKILAALRNLFGGNVRAYESLLDRAKREAILRLKEQVPDYDVIVNLRMETSTLAYSQSRKKGTGGVEVIAYGTAIRYN